MSIKNFKSLDSRIMQNEKVQHYLAVLNIEVQNEEEESETEVYLSASEKKSWSKTSRDT